MSSRKGRTSPSDWSLCGRCGRRRRVSSGRSTFQCLDCHHVELGVGEPGAPDALKGQWVPKAGNPLVRVFQPDDPEPLQPMSHTDRVWAERQAEAAFWRRYEQVNRSGTEAEQNRMHVQAMTRLGTIRKAS